MKTLQYTTTGSLSMHAGILTHVGDYAGKYQQEAIELIIEAKIDCDDTNLVPQNCPGFWADIMQNRSGEVFAVWAEGELTSYQSHCEYVKITEDDINRHRIIIEITN